MRAPRPLCLILLALSITLAGCAAPSAQEDQGWDTGADDTYQDGGSTDAAPVGDGAGGGDGASGAGERWYAYAFDEPVTPRSGGSGSIESFRYELTEEQDGEELVLDVTVDVLGTAMQDIRTKRMSVADGYTEDTVSAPVEVTEIRHTIRVVKDDSGERAVGATATATALVPTDEAARERTFLLGFAKLSWTDEEGATGAWEYYLTPEMSAQSDSGEVFFLPFQEGEGDITGDWMWQIFVMTYDPVWLSGWADGDQSFEEGEWGFGGYRYVSERKTLEVGGYVFDGWHVEWTAEADGSTARHMFEAASTLPIPFAYDFGGSDTSGAGDASSNHWRFQLKDLQLS